MKNYEFDGKTYRRQSKDEVLRRLGIKVTKENLKKVTIRKKSADENKM